MAHKDQMVSLGRQGHLVLLVYQGHQVTSALQEKLAKKVHQDRLAPKESQDQLDRQVHLGTTVNLDYQAQLGYLGLKAT